MDVFEPTRVKEYDRALAIRLGLDNESEQFCQESYPIRIIIRNQFAAAWAGCHNQKAIQNVLDRWIERLSDNETKTYVPEHMRMYVLNYAFKVFKIAWINYTEILPKENQNEN